MLDWRAVTGTSIAHGILGLVLAGIAAPTGYIVCADCGRGWIFVDPTAPPTLTMPPHVIVLPVEAKVQPALPSNTPYRPDVRGLCPGQPTVDRLPALIVTTPSGVFDPQAFTACIRIDDTGKVDRIVLAGRHVVGADQKLRRRLTLLRFVPASRDGTPVASWIMLRSDI